MPVSISSTETMTAGRCLPGSPLRAAPRATSQRSPRRGSGNAVIYGVVPVALLVVDGVDIRFGASGVAFGAEDRLVLGTGGQICEEGGNGYPAFTRLGGGAGTGLYRNPDRSPGARRLFTLFRSLD